MIGVLGLEDFKLRCKVGEAALQDVFVDIEVELDLSNAIVGDDLSETVSYEDIVDVLEMVVEGNSFHLIEKLAYTLLHALFDRFPVSWASVKVKQPQAIGLAKNAHVELEAFAEEEE